MKGRDIKIAIFMDFVGGPISGRDGITVFLKHALLSWLKYNPLLKVEMWVYYQNEESLKVAFADVLESYGDRIEIYTNLLCRDSNQGSILHFFKMSLYEKLSVFFKRNSRIEKYFYKKFLLHKEIYEDSKLSLAKSFNQVSKADVCYVPFVGLQEALQVNRPIVMQVHDLFTFILCDLFQKQSLPRGNWKKHNERIKQNLIKYSKKNTYFVCSSEFTKNEQILKYIPIINESSCKVISFPPLLKDYSNHDVMSEEEFRKKYNIYTKYIAFPSQNRPNKNIITLLKAIKRVNDKGIDIKLVTTGKMEHVLNTKKYVSENPGLVLEIGSISTEDLYCLYKYSALVVCPNIIEGMLISGQGLEALMIGGIPVAHGKSLGIEESLKSVGLDFESANLNWFDLYDDKQVASIIEDILYLPMSHIEKQKGIIDAYTRKTWDDFAEKFTELFNELCVDEKG